MVRSVRAIYEDGVFRPVDTLEGLPERAAVRLRVEEVPSDGARLSDFAGLWPADEADEIAAIVEAEFRFADQQ